MVCGASGHVTLVLDGKSAVCKSGGTDNLKMSTGSQNAFPLREKYGRNWLKEEKKTIV